MKNLIILSAPSGTGKTTLCKKIQKVFLDVEWSVSYTTRLIRKGEKNGKDYNFISLKLFNDMIKNKYFVEWENVHGELYGTIKKNIDFIIKQNKLLLLELDVKGALNVKKLYPDNTYSIFIIPPSISDLKKRLKNRNTESDKKIKIRLNRFKEEIKYKSNFDYIMINNNLEVAFEELVSIINKIRKGIK